MSTADRKPGFDPDPPQRGSVANGLGGGRAGQGIWLDGDVLACACPECSAPMSIRLWLMVADCWRCGASLELSQEQEREALRLLEQREQARPTTAPPAAISPPPKPRPARVPTVAAAASPLAVPAVQPRRIAAHENRLKSRLQEFENQTDVDRMIRGVLRDLPAWLASLIVHLVLLIVLAVWLMGGIETSKPTITLIVSTNASSLHKPGEDKAEAQPDPVEFEKPGDDEKMEDAPEKPAEEAAAEEPPMPPQKQPADPFKELGDRPEPIRAAGAATAATVNPEMISGRTATARRELVKQEGGTSATEAAVGRGLKWLARHQNEDGSWSLDGFHKTGDCRGRCRHAGFDSDVAGTALALLPFLGAGQTHLHGDYQEEVEQGLRWLVRQQKSDGDLPSPVGNSHMYAHGQGAIALCEAYALTRDEFLRVPAQRAVDFIVAAQHREGGWRYQPGERGDTSVVGWQLMALRSAQMGYLVVPPETFERAQRFLDDVQTDSAGGKYAYMPNNNESYVMTAEALLCRQYSGWPHDHPGLVTGSRYLLDKHPPRVGGKINMYYCYYATQVMHHLGGDAWEAWNAKMRDALVASQEIAGHMAGSWTPTIGHDDAGGRVYMTALAVCTLEVYYRHLPLYRPSAAAAE